MPLPRVRRVRPLGSAHRTPKGVFLVHGEYAEADNTLRLLIRDELGVEAFVAEDAVCAVLVH
jgi:hypothetical protein